MAAEAGNGRPFVGRAEAVDALYRRFEDARAGSGGVTLLVGATGVGKSTLVSELVRSMRSRDTQVLVGRAPALDAPAPFTLIRSALESIREPSTGRTEGHASGGPLSEQVLIGFAPRLGDAGLAPPVEIEERLLSALDDVDERSESVQDPIWAAITEQFLEFTRRGPTVLVLEDLHRSDESSLEALESLVRQLPNRPLWVVATARPFETLSAARRSRLEAFEAATHARRVVLRPFTSEEVAHYLRWREPERAFTSEEVARRYSETGGNPLLLEQFDRRLIGSRDTGGRPSGAAFDPAPLATLSEESERVLGVASVLGPEFSFALLLRASGEDEERLAETVDDLVHRGLLLERPGETLAFAEDAARSRIYDRLVEDRRRLLHRKAGEAIEATTGVDLQTIYALARHFYLGRVDDKALQYNRAAGEIAERSFAPESAREHLERALECQRRLKPEDVDGESELLLEIAQQVDHMGELRAAEEILRGQLDRPGVRDRLAPHVRALLELYLAQIQTSRGEWRAAEAATAAVLQSADLSGHPLVRIGLHRLRGEALYYEGRYPEALAEHTEELALARSSGTERATALGLVRRAYVLAMLGQAEGAMSEARHAAQILERLGDAREAAQAHLFLGVVLAGNSALSSRYAEATAEFSEAIRLAEKAHDARRIGWALFNSADILREAGRLDEAAERCRRARETLERMGDRFGLVQSMIVQGKIELDRGEYDRAEADLLDAYRLVRELQAPADEVDVVLRLAQLSYARGDRATARRRVAELERQNLSGLRPDVVPDFERLKKDLAAPEGGGRDAR